jgi:hypothetical protein
VPMIMRGRILGLGRRLGLAVAGHCAATACARAFRSPAPGQG